MADHKHDIKHQTSKTSVGPLLFVQRRKICTICHEVKDDGHWGIEKNPEYKEWFWKDD